MTAGISLKEAERKVFTSTFQDGLTDILIGSFFLTFAIAPFLSSTMGDFWAVAVFVPFWAVLWIAGRVIRHRVIRPRTGYVSFGAARKARLRKFTTLMLIANIILFILGAVAAFNVEAMPGRVISVVFGFMLLAGFSVAAYFLDFRRLFVYGLLVGFSPLIGEWLFEKGIASHHGFPIVFGIAAAVMILCGLFLFVRLLRRSPLPAAGFPAEESPDD